MYDHADLQPKGVRNPVMPSVVEDSVLYKTTLFGPT